MFSCVLVCICACGCRRACVCVWSPCARDCVVGARARAWYARGVAAHEEAQRALHLARRCLAHTCQTIPLKVSGSFQPRSAIALVAWQARRQAWDFQLLASSCIDDGVVEGTLGQHRPKGRLDGMVLPANEHLRNPHPAQRRLGQRRKLLYCIWSDLLRAQFRFGHVVGPLPHFPVAIHNIPILLQSARKLE